MKTHKNLWPKIATFRNLLRASEKARRGKRLHPNVARFEVGLETELFQLLRELEAETYHPGPYTSFQITDPKPRQISAAPYRDRVVHHALCNWIAPILEHSMIDDSYANRTGKGSRPAVERFQKFARQFPFVLKCDVKKFFPSIDHEILKREIRRKIACRRTLELCDLIIDNSNPQEEHMAYFPGDDLFTPSSRRRGLPIGNLTSQLWGNFFLNRMDHFIREKLGCGAYLRYVDDFAIFGHDKAELQRIRHEIEVFLQDFRLLLHERKTRIFQTSEGVTFLGYRVFPTFRLLPSANVRKFRKRAAQKTDDFHAGKITLKQFSQSMKGWEGHALGADTVRLRRKLTKEIWGIERKKPLDKPWTKEERARRRAQRKRPVPGVAEVPF